MTQKQYSHLNFENLEAISRGLAASLSFAEIARQIGLPTCTVSREVKKNYGRHSYQCCSADRKVQKLMGRRRSGKRKLFGNNLLARYVHRGFKWE